PHLLAALRTRQDDLVDPRPVEIHAVRVSLRLPQRVRGAHDDPVAALRAPPDGERDPPVPLAGEAPIPQVLGPVHLTGRARPFWIPRDPANLVDHFPLDRRDSQEPLDRRAVEDWRLAAPAVTVGMDQRLRGEESVRGAEVLDDHRVRLFDRLVGVHARLLREMAPSVDRTEDRQPEGLPEFEIFRTVTRCAVDEARVLRLYGGRGDHAMDPLPRRGRLIGDLVREGVRI